MSALLARAFTFGEHEERIARESVMLFGLLAIVMLILSAFYLLFAVDQLASDKYSTLVIMVPAIFGPLAATRFVRYMWVVYLIPGVSIVALAWLQPTLVMQLLGFSMVVLRLTLPRAVAIVFMLSLAVMVQMAVGLGDHSAMWMHVIIANSNAILAFLLVDQLLRHFRDSVAERRLVLFDAIYPYLLMALLLRSVIVVVDDGSIEAWRYSIFGLLVLGPLLWRWQAKAFGYAIPVLLGLTSLLMWSNAFADQWVFGRVWPVLLCAMLLVLDGVLQRVLLIAFAASVLVHIGRMPITLLYSGLWAIFGLLVIGVLLQRTLDLLQAPQAGNDRYDLLGVSRVEWRPLAIQFAGRLVVLLVLTALLLWPAFKQLSTNQIAQKYADHKQQITAINSQQQDLLAALITAQADALTSSPFDLEAWQRRGTALIEQHPSLAAWRVVDADDRSLIDVRPHNVVSTITVDGAALARQLRYARRVGPGRAFVSRPVVARHSLNARDDMAWLYVVTSRYSPSGQYLGALVANVTLDRLFSDVIRLAELSDVSQYSIIDRDGDYLMPSAKTFTWLDYKQSDNGLAIDDYQAYLTIRKLYQGTVRSDDNVLEVLPLVLGRTGLPAEQAYSQAPEGFLVIDRTQERLIDWGMQRSGFWVLVVLLFVLLAAMSLWSTLAWRSEQQLKSRLASLQLLQHEAERATALVMQSEQNKALFLSNMSHEMRTPLNGLIGVGQVLQRGVPADQIPSLFQILQHSADRLKTLVDDVLDIQAFQQGGLRLKGAPFNLAENVASIAYKQQLVAHRKGLTFVSDCTRLHFPVRVGDEQRVGQILDNLLTNAIKFTEVGGIRLAVSGDRNHVHMVVEDTGIGMTPQVQKTIFERFQQGDLSSTKRHQGAGLGLSICDDLVGMMGGRIEVFSQVGEGSRFEVWLPLAAVSSMAESTAVSDSRLNGRVLVVDDDSTNRLVLSRVLASWGIHVQQAENGQDALALLQRENFDVVLTDIAMPIMTGTELLQALRERGDKVPCMALTGNIGAEVMAALNDLDFCATFIKPIDFDEMRAALSKQLEAATIQ